MKFDEHSPLAAPLRSWTVTSALLLAPISLLGGGCTDDDGGGDGVAETGDDDDDDTTTTGDPPGTGSDDGEESSGGEVLECQDVDLGNAVPQSTMGDNTDATDDFTPSCAAGNSNDVVYAFTAPADGSYFITTAGSGIDTVLSVHDSCEGDAVSCNDDYADILQSRLIVSMSADQEILIVVDGFDADGLGEHILSIDEACDGDQYVTDGSMEMGKGAAWESTSTNFPSVLCTSPDCATPGDVGPSEGAWWAWFGGVAADETGTLNQDVEIGGGATTLSFQLLLHAFEDGDAGSLVVDIDGAVVWEMDTADFVPLVGEGYGLVQIDITDYADGSVHNLGFTGTTTGGVANIIVDEISISCGTTYSPCGEGTSCGDEGTCIVNSIRNPTIGVCAEECADASECPAVPVGATAACSDITASGANSCFLDCSVSGSCPDGMFCLADTLCTWPI